MDEGQWRGDLRHDGQPFTQPLAWGRCTKKVDAKGATLYLHIFEWPKNGEITVPGIKNDAEAAYMLSDPAKKPLETEAEKGGGITIDLPEKAPDAISSTLVLRVKGPLDINQPPAPPPAQSPPRRPARTRPAAK